MFICVKEYIACVKSWADEDFEIIVAEVKGKDT
jgi:hypothetical protein